jgi:hypothetical protein
MSGGLSDLHSHYDTIEDAIAGVIQARIDWEGEEPEMRLFDMQTGLHVDWEAMAWDAYAEQMRAGT